MQNHHGCGYGFGGAGVNNRILPVINAAFLAMAMLALVDAKMASAEDCPIFPEVAWWDLTHENVIKYVEVNHDGDWEPYIAKWESHAKKAEAVHAKGNALVSPTGVKISGDALKTYIGQIYQRVKVSRCLADNYKKQNRDGGKTKAKKASPAKQAEMAGGAPGVKTTAIKTEDFNLNILTTCQNGEFVFEVVNKGDDWPDSASFRIISKNGIKTFSTRGLKLARNEKTKFTLKPEEITGEAGIRIEPLWTSQYVEYGEKISCSF